MSNTNLSDLSLYARDMIGQEIGGDEIASELKKAFFDFCSSTAPDGFSTVEDRLGYSYIFMKNFSKMIEGEGFNPPIFVIEPGELDNGIDEGMVAAMVSDIDEFCAFWCAPENTERHKPLVVKLIQNYPNAFSLINILGIALGLPDSNDPKAVIAAVEEQNPEIVKINREIDEINQQIREHQLRQAAVIHSYIKAVRVKKFPIDEKKLILNYFKELENNPGLAWETLISSPASFSPIIVDRLAAKGIKKKDLPLAATKANKEIADFLKGLKI